MKKENSPNNITEPSIEKDIKNLFNQSVKNIGLTEHSKNKLYNIPHNIETQTPLQRFLEKEIIIPLPSLAIFTSLAIMLIGVYIGNIMLIDDVPSPRYEIINMQSMDNTAHISQVKGW